MTTSAHIDRFILDSMPPPEQWPEFIFETPELQFPQRMNATAWLLDRAVAEGDGERVAIISGELRWSYRELQQQVNRLARLLTEDLGVQTGNRVLLRGMNSPWLAAGWLASLTSSRPSIPLPKIQPWLPSPPAPPVYPRAAFMLIGTSSPCAKCSRAIA